MCKGTRATMACGHTLWHWTTRCPPEKRLQCKKEPTDWRFIDDTCADCDPSVRRKMLRAAYEQERARLVARYCEARGAGDGALMAELEHRMVMDISEVRTANFEIGLARGDVDVTWEL